MKIWYIGAYGIVSTTAMVGGKLIEKNIVDKTGLVSELRISTVLKNMPPSNSNSVVMRLGRLRTLTKPLYNTGMKTDISKGNILTRLKKISKRLLRQRELP